MTERNYARLPGVLRHTLLCVESELVRRIRAARGYSGLSQPALAEALGVSKDTLARIERGERDLLGYELRGFIASVAEATQLPVEFFTVDREFLGAPPQLLDEHDLQRPPYDEQSMMDATVEADRANRVLVEEFGRAAPGAALMLKEILGRLAEVKVELRRTAAAVDPELAKELGDAIDQAAADLEENARGDDPPSTATGS